jgi:hypothetical protein
MLVKRGATSGIKRLALVEGLARYLRPVKRLFEGKREASGAEKKQQSDPASSDPYLYSEENIPVSDDPEPTWWHTDSSPSNTNTWKLKAAIYHSLYEIYHTYRENGLGKYAQNVLNANQKYETDGNVRKFLEASVMYSFAPLKEFQPKSMLEDDADKANSLISSGMSKMVLRMSLTLAEENAECEDRDKFLENYLRVCEKLKEQQAVKKAQDPTETLSQQNDSDKKGFTGDLVNLKPESLRPEFQYENLDKLMKDSLPVFSNESYHNAYKLVVQQQDVESVEGVEELHENPVRKEGLLKKSQASLLSKRSTETIEVKSSNVSHQDIPLRLREPLVKIIETPAAGAANRRKMYDFRSVTGMSSANKEKEKEMEKEKVVGKLNALLPKSAKKDNLPRK